MPTSLSYQVVDADNHYYEVDDCFSRHLESKYADHAIIPLPARDGNGRRWTMNGQELQSHPRNIYDGVPAPGAMLGLFSGTVQVDEVDFGEPIRPAEHPPMIERNARVKLMDEQGVQSSVMLPTSGLHIEHEFKTNVEALCANYRSFNRWLEEDWGYGADGRIFGVPMLNILDQDWAISEVKRVAELGAKLIYVRLGPIEGRSPADPHFDRFWATVQDAGLNPIFHAGESQSLELYGKHWGEDPHNADAAQSAFQHYVSEHQTADTVAALILHNLFGRFPRLKALIVELGGNWVAPLLPQLDIAAKFCAGGTWLGGKIEGLPSEIAREHIYVSPYPEDDIIRLAQVLSPDRVLCGSDWPHPEGLANPLDYVDYLGGFSDEDVEKIMRGNTAKLLGV